MISKDKTYTVTIEKIVFGAWGLGRIDNKVCFVPYVLPEEEVKVRITEEKKDYSYGRSVGIVKPSTARVQAPCKYYQECGGCHYQHLSYPDQLTLKTKQVKDVMRRIYGSVNFPVNDTIPSDDPFYYRNDVKLTRNSQRLDFRYGFVGTDHVSVLPVDECMIVSKRINREIACLLNDKEKHAKKLTIKSDASGRVSYWPGLPNVLHSKVNGKKVYYDGRIFFQANQNILEKIIQHILDMDIYSKDNSCLFDLYGGVGVFSVALCDQFEKGILIEENRKATRYFEKAVKDNNLEADSFKIYRNRVEDVFGWVFDKEHKKNNVVFLDPPRMGLDEKLVSEISKRHESIQHVLYLSCNPSTLARDLKRFERDAAWHVKELWPFDMFPQTKHIECLAWLTKS